MKAFEALKRLIIILENTEKISVYAAATALYYATKLDRLNSDLLKTSLSCIEQKLEFIDSRSLSQALWAVSTNPGLAKHPIVDKLLKAASIKDLKSKTLSVESGRWNASLFREIPEKKSNNVLLIKDALVNLKANRKNVEEFEKSMQI
jgi:hypothetical protein